MAYTSAADWLRRFEAAGCRMEVDASSIRASAESKGTSACQALWAEIRGPDNLQRWTDVEAEVRKRVESLAACTEFPIKS